MLYGWTGTNLEVDLSQGKIEKVKGDPKLVEDYLGGKGINAKILWDRVPPEVDPFSPDNLLIVTAGLLAGTMVPSANNTCISFKSPVTDLHSYSSIGGSFAPELKHAGYDTIIISGKSPTLVYLWIKDDHVELRDASHLLGKSTYETQRLIREELKVDKAQTICIGPAGENKVFAASIEHSNGASASRGGAGALMGDKNLKAITVYGTKDVNIAKPARLVELCEQILSRTDPIRKECFEPYGLGLVSLLLRAGAYGNYAGDLTPEFKELLATTPEMAQNFIDTTRVREVACYNCGIRCKHVYRLPDGTYSHIKCRSWSAAAIATKIIDFDFIMQFYNKCEKYGLDTESIGNQIMFAIDLYQRGIITKKDTGGLHLEWENPDVAFTLLDQIVYREGIGNILADGVYRAAQKIGGEAPKYAIHLKKLDDSLFGIRGAWAALRRSVNDKADGTRLEELMVSMVWPRSREDKEAHIKAGFFTQPEELQKYFLEDFDFTGENYEGIVQITAYDEETYGIADMTGLCWFWLLFYWLPPINSRPLMADLISSATGMDIDEARLTEVARRLITLVRAYNVREGMKREDDRISEKFFEMEPPPEYAKYRKLTHELHKKLIDRWYELKGFNKEGVPTKETLEKYGLDYVHQELKQRGFSTD